MIGFFASSFDPFVHPGHIWAMQQAVMAHNLTGIIVGLHEDPTIERPETKRKPALTTEERTVCVAAIRDVVGVRPYNLESELYAIIKDVQPVLRILGEDYRGRPYTGDDLGIPVFYATRCPVWSGTEFSRRLLQRLG